MSSEPRTNYRTVFGDWIRDHPLMQEGYVVQDIDLVIRRVDLQRGLWMIIEEKCNHTLPGFPQRQTYDWMTAACEHDPTFWGSHLVVFAGAGPDTQVSLDGRLVTLQEFEDFLTFKTRYPSFQWLDDSYYAKRQSS